MDAARFGEPVADLAEIARAAAPGDDPPERAADVGQRAQHARASRRAAAGRRGATGPGRAAPRSPRASASGAARSSASWRAPAPVTQRSTAAIRLPRAPAALRLEDLEAGARRLVHRQRAAAARARPAAAAAAACRARRGRDRRAARPPRRASRRRELRRTRRAWRRRATALSRASPSSLAKSRRGRGIASSGRVRPSPRARPVSLAPSRASAAPSALGRAFLELHPPGRDVAGGDAARAAHLAHRGQHVGPARLEQRFLGQRAGGDEADDVARDQRLRAAALLAPPRGFRPARRSPPGSRP